MKNKNKNDMVKTQKKKINHEKKDRNYITRDDTNTKTTQIKPENDLYIPDNQC